MGDNGRFPGGSSVWGPWIVAVCLCLEPRVPFTLVYMYTYLKIF